MHNPAATHHCQKMQSRLEAEVDRLTWRLSKVEEEVKQLREVAQFQNQQFVDQRKIISELTNLIVRERQRARTNSGNSGGVDGNISGRSGNGVNNFSGYGGAAGVGAGGGAAVGVEGQEPIPMNLDEWEFDAQLDILFGSLDGESQKSNGLNSICGPIEASSMEYRYLCV